MAKKPIPQFSDEDEEREFWAKHDVLDYFDEMGVDDINLPKLKPSTSTISLRLPQSLLERIRSEANKRDIPYQTYMKIKLDELFGNPAAKQ